MLFKSESNSKEVITCIETINGKYNKEFCTRADLNRHVKKYDEAKTRIIDKINRMYSTLSAAPIIIAAFCLVVPCLSDI